MPRVSHVGAALVGSSGVAHLNGVDAVLAGIQLLLSEFPFVFNGDFGADLWAIVLRVILSLKRGE